jgi:hypothetical protein
LGTIGNAREHGENTKIQKNQTPNPLPHSSKNGPSWVHVESPHCLIGGMKNLFPKLFVAIFWPGLILLSKVGKIWNFKSFSSLKFNFNFKIFFSQLGRYCHGPIHTWASGVANNSKYISEQNYDKCKIQLEVLR